MSGEQLSVARNLKSQKSTFDSRSARKYKKISSKVDINHLMLKVREEQKKEKKSASTTSNQHSYVSNPGNWGSATNG